MVLIFNASFILWFLNMFAWLIMLVSDCILKIHTEQALSMLLCYFKMFPGESKFVLPALDILYVSNQVSVKFPWYRSSFPFLRWLIYQRLLLKTEVERFKIKCSLLQPLISALMMVIAEIISAISSVPFTSLRKIYVTNLFI